MDQRGYVLAVERYPSSAVAVGEARALAGRVYAPYPWVDHDTVKLLVSETATNAVLHAGGGGFDLICHSPVRGSVQIEVHDRSKAEPRRRPHTAWDSHGRGLELLDLLAPGWGVVPTHTGKGLVFAVTADPPESAYRRLLERVLLGLGGSVPLEEE
ncbi:ATP-binding protein [Streptomyces liangshanensis]|uniref:ATP-binding protein n=1 Tax=Streptomyces liangshanensis TaxID=2717324 RepID=UPI001AAF3BC2|nr:ATP-binding protein [Streptomyces liangshanensis]